MKVPNAKSAWKQIANTLGWTHEATTPLNEKLECSGLAQNGVYTFLSVLGYIQKDSGTQWFELMRTENVTDNDLCEGQ